jgi:hypothetical protein
LILITVATTNGHQRIPVTIVPNMNLLKFHAHFNSELMGLTTNIPIYPLLVCIEGGKLAQVIKLE